MNITVIGTGNVGTTLAIAFRKAGHSVIFGVRDANADFKGKALAVEHAIAWFGIDEAVKRSDVIVLSAPGHVAHEVAQGLGDVHDKVIIDTMNAAFKKPAHYSNTALAVLDNCNATQLVKCFNTTGFENMANPRINGESLDMFVAGSSEEAKRVATQLAKDIGFGEVYDFGGNDKFDLIEQFALCWINLALVQMKTRRMGFRVVK